MGLTVSYGCYDGSYGGFTDLRIRIAKAIGESVGVDEHGEMLLLWNREWPEDSAYGKWPRGEPKDPIYVLLQHADNEGHIAKRHLIPLAERLEAIADVQVETRPASWRYDFASELRKFAEGLRVAHAEGKKVEFS